MTKLTSEIVHFNNRATERHGLTIKGLHKQFKHLIQSGKSRLIVSQSKSRKVHLVPYGGREYRVVYDSKRGCCVTILP